MGDTLLQALVNEAGVAVGLYALWLLIGTAPGSRAGYAAVAGVVSAMLTFIITASVSGVA